MKTRKTIAMLLAVGMFLAAGGAAQAALVLTQGGYDAQTSSSNMPVAAFSSPLGNHSRSQAHNTAWTRSGNHQGAAGVIAAPLAGGPAAATSSPNVTWHNSDTRGTQTQTLGGTMDANTQYTLSFDGAIRDQGQFGGGGANIISNLGSFDLTAIAVGSVDGTLAEQDFAPSFTSTGTWQNFSLGWDSTGKNLSQTVTIAIGANRTSGSTGLQFLTDSVTLSSGPAPPPAPLSLVNGGFDDDGALGGIPSSITGWNRTNGNAGWQTGSPAPVAPPTTSPNVALLNSFISSSQPGTELTSVPLGGNILPGTGYALSFDAAIRDQGQFGGGQNIINNLGPYSVIAELVGSVDGVLASTNVAPGFTSVNHWHAGSLAWDSTGATAAQDVRVVLRAENTGNTHLQFVMDSVTLASGPLPPPVPLSLLNGGFDDDGTLSGVPTSITGWRLTNFNAGWQTGSPPGGPPSADTDPNVALLNSNRSSRGFPGTELTSDPLAGDIVPGTMYDLSGVAAIRDQGQFGGGQSIVNNLGPYSLLAILEGSVDGELARIDVAPLLTSVDAWHPFSLTWDSTGATQGQDVRILLRIENTGNTDLQFLMDSLAWTAQPSDIPEPASAVLFAVGMAGVALWRRRNRRIQA